MADSEKNQEKSPDDPAKSTEAPPDCNDKTKGHVPRELTTREAYFASLNEWVQRANMSQNAMAMFPFYFMSSYPQLFQQQQPVFGQPVNQQQQQSQARNAPLVNGLINQNIFNNNNNIHMAQFRFRLLSDQAQADIIARTGGYEYTIAPLWKRAAAELIDMVIMLFIKIVTIFVITNIFGYDLMMDMDKDAIKAMDNEDFFAGALLYSMDFLAFSSDLLAFEIATKVFVCLYEALMTTYFDGASVGKHVMGLSIKYVEAMALQPNVPIPQVPQIQLGFQNPRVQMRALLFPAETPKFKRAFMRAVAKNIILSLLFPMCFLMIFFKNNRMAYDIMTHTCVVEKPLQAPVLRNQQQQQQPQQ